MEQIVYDEVYAVLCALGDDYVAKVPMDLLNLIATKKSDNYVYIDQNKRLEDQNLTRETHMFIAMLHYDYWCETEEEKQKLTQILEDNEQKLYERLASASSIKEFQKLLKER